VLKLKKHAKAGVEIPTSSLADIVFLLLIFFLVTTSMNPARGLGMTLPEAGEQVEIQKTNVLNVFVNAQGAILVGGNETSLENLQMKIEEERVKYKEARGDTMELIISLQTHKDANYRNMIDVLDEIKLAGAKKISIATPEF